MGERTKMDSDQINRLEAMLATLLSPQMGQCTSGKPNNFIKESMQNSTSLIIKISPTIKTSSADNCVINKPFSKCLNLRTIVNKNYLGCTKWVLDSGATNHMTGNHALLKNYRTLKRTQYFTIVNNEKIKIERWGMISIFKKGSSKMYFM
jgi:hypothetical protein